MFGNRKLLECAVWLVLAGLCASASDAQFDKCNHIVMHLWPEVVATEELKHFHLSWVAHEGVVMTFSKTIEEHENALEYVYKCLYDAELYISPKKFKPYTIRFNCLGHYHDECGLQASTDKLEIIRKWPMLSSYHDVQQFLGLVEYISRFLPNVLAYTTPLSGMCTNGLPFIW
jgi:hypothetical protein